VAALVTTIVDVGHQGAGVFNVGASPSVSIGDLARQVVATVGSGAVTSTPWPPESRHIETGHYVGDYRRVRVAYGWTATTPLGEGLEAAWRRHRASVPA
jgi:nucleoside-diphosphate-sugar epimerase